MKVKMKLLKRIKRNENPKKEEKICKRIEKLGVSDSDDKREGLPEWVRDVW